MRFIQLFVLLAFLTSLPLVLHTQNSNELLAAAKTSYDKGNYNAAIKAYEGLVEEGYNSSDLHFNLASSYFKAGQLASAVLYYEKVLKQSPGHKGASTNLRIVQDQRASELSAIPDFFIAVWWRNFSGFLSSGLWSVLSLLTLLASLLLFYKRLFKGTKMRSLMGSMLLFLLAILFLSAAMTSNTLRNKTTHLVNLENAMIYTDRNTTSESLAQIIPGEKLRIQDKVGEWYRVLLINKVSGWIPDKNLEEI